MRSLPLVLVLVALPVHAEDLGLKVPPNFKVTLWADQSLANDIYTMALDEKGRVVVSGPGYIRRLEDTDNDGKADKATDIAETKTGAMGLLFAQDGLSKPRFALYASLDGKIRGFTPTANTPEFEPYNEKLPVFPFSEHGGHSLRLGPSGDMVAVGGNNAGLNEWKAMSTSPIRNAEGGGFIHFPGWQLQYSNVIAHGFRNPYDFDFTPLGDIITFDSDSERDYLLPWYSPTRVYHVMPGMHHGWRLPGGSRSLARRDYYPDTVPVLAHMGRGSPTGVCSYRHTQFPAHYRGGVFLLDWTFGRIHYLPLIPEGSSYKQVKPELFLEPTGTNGFAPTAARVAPDGSLFVSIGGRGTRGAVYRIEYLVDGKHPVVPRAEPEKDIDKVLDAPQPLESWSMAKWLPLTDKIIGDDLNVILDETESDYRRIRALDLVCARPGNLATAVQEALRYTKSDLVRAHLAKCLGTDQGQVSIEILWSATKDYSPRVRCEALKSIGDILSSASKPKPIDIDALCKCLDDPEQRIRLAASRVLSGLTAKEHKQVQDLVRESGSSLGMVSCFVAGIWPDRPRVREKLAFADAIRALEFARNPHQQLNALRAIMLYMGDWNIKTPSVELLSAFSLNTEFARTPGWERMLSREAVHSIRPIFPSKDPQLNIEASRLLAMLEDDDPASVEKMLAQITADSHPTWDFHYLTVLARLTAPRKQSQTQRVANALLALEGKLEKRNLRVESNWPLRLRELVSELLRTHPGLDKLLVAHEKLVAPGHVLIASQLRLEARRAAAGRFFEAVRDNPEFPLSNELVQLLATLPPEEVRPLLRSRWADRSVRDAIVKQLATKPEEIDRAKFLEALETGQGEAACLTALEALPRDPSPRNLVPLFARLRQALSDPKEKGIRKQLVELVTRQTGQAFAIEETKSPTPLGETYQPLFAWFEKTHPTEAKRLTTASEDEAAIRNLAKSVDWGAGNVARGIKVFDRLGCQACHGNSTRLGPDLAGSGIRMSRDDLLTAILNPSRDVAPIYRVTNIETKDNKRISGLIAYDSSEALLVHLGTGETKRIAVPDIESRSPSMKSLMPDGLLKGIKPEELADLFAFLARQ